MTALTLSPERPVADARIDGPRDSFDSLDLLTTLARFKKLIACFLALSLSMGLALALLLPKTYTAGAKLLPPMEPESMAMSLMGQLGGLGSLAARDLGVKNPADTYVAMIRSRTVADAVIAKFDLRSVYQRKTMTETRKALDSILDVKAGKDGVIVLSVDDHDAKRAAGIANEIIAQLHNLTGSLALTESSQRRKFFENEVASARDALEQAEREMQTAQEKSGLMQLDGQAKVMIESVASLKAAVYAKQLELRSMSTFATDGNPDVVRAKTELAGLQSQLAETERKRGGGNGDVLVPTGQLPAVGLAYIDHLRELKYREEVFELMAKQYETAKLDEAKEPAGIQVIDSAVVPDRHSSPKRSLVVLASGIFGILAGCWMALCKDNLRRHPESALKLRLAGRLLLGRE